MKNVVLALLLAMASSLALAQSQITAYGRMNVYAVDQSNGDNSPGWTMSNESSRIGFKAVEKLSNGFNARATIETSVNSAAPDLGLDTKLGNRASLVGLANKTFSVDLGRDFHSYFFLIRSVDPFWARLNGSVSQDVFQFHDRRLSNTVFVKAELIPGLRLSVDRQLTNDQTSMGKAEATTASLAYTHEKFMVAAAVFDQGPNQSGMALLKVNLGKGYVGLMRSNDTVVINGARIDSNGTMLSLEQPVPDTAFTAKAALGRTDTGMTSVSVGTDYAFSKSVNARLIYRNANHDDNRRDVRQAVLGLEYKF